MTDVAVDRLENAKTGDLVWFYDSQHPVYVDGKYQGRGHWSLHRIISETRASFAVGQYKFDRKDGIQRATGGYLPTIFICGESERNDREWIRANQKEIVKIIECMRIADIETLKAVAALVGFNPEDQS